ncbi:hypothetical protein AOLI_G00188620 [Acnodon oligacanthus]
MSIRAQPRHFCALLHARALVQKFKTQRKIPVTLQRTRIGSSGRFSRWDTKYPPGSRFSPADQWPLS